MVQRWTLDYQTLESQARMRNDALRRRSSGFKYYLLLPVAVYVILAALIWGAIMMAYSCVGPRR